MTRSSRFIPARVVGAVEFAGETNAVAGPKSTSAKDRKIRRKLRAARRLKKKIARFQEKHPIGWRALLATAKRNLRIVMGDLKALGWKPKKPSRAPKPGEDDVDAALDDIPENEPGESDDDPDLDQPEEGELPDPDTVTEGNWLDTYVGAEPPKRPLRDVLQRAERLVAPKWSKPVPIGDGGQIQTRPGQRAMVATVQPGLFIVQLVSDQAAQRLAGDNVGILPLLLYPLVKNEIQKILAPKPAAHPVTAPVAPLPPQPAPGAVGCDCPAPRVR